MRFLRRFRCLQHRSFMLFILSLLFITMLMAFFDEHPEDSMVYFPPLKPHIWGKEFTDVREKDLRQIIDMKPISKDKINGSQVAVVTAASEGFFRHLRKMVDTAQKKLFLNIIVYDIGMTPKQVEKVKTWCGVEYRMFDFWSYPGHVQYLTSYAFKPLVIADALKDFSAILWVDTSVEFTLEHDLSEFYKTAQASDGLVIFHGTGHSIHSVTPPKMSEYLPFTKDSKKTECLVATAIGIFRTDYVVNNFIRWWVACALSPSCIYSEENRLCTFTFNSNISAWDDYGQCSRFDQSAMTILVENMYSDNSFPPKLKKEIFKIERVKANIEHPLICDEPPQY